jgi:RNA polymerase sigma-70 factor (ECF subfamily)
LTKEDFKNIYDCYFDIIRNHIYYRSGDVELATDIAQEVFVKVWEKQLEAKQGNYKSLLYKIAGDIFISHMRHQKVVLDSVPEIQFRFHSQANIQEGESELLKKYQKVLAQLPEKQRIVFLMNKMDGFTYNEIAADLNLSVKAVEKRMGLALKTLKKEVLES